MAEVSFGEWLKRHRKGLGLTQHQLAAQIICSTVALKKIEAEERHPSAQIVERLAEIFNIPQNERTLFLRFARGDWKSVPVGVIEDTPWRSSTKFPRSNLPASLTLLIGRERELAGLGEYLSDTGKRLITLIGPPGIGKTRLSIEAARAGLSNFPEGVFFIALAPLEDPDLVAPTIAQTLGFVEVHNQSHLERLKDGIGDKQMLIVLDNIEHLIVGTATLVSELLSACPRLKILGTSREALRVPGEWLYAVPTLVVPTESSSMHMEIVSQFSALILFVERARAVRSDFVINADNIQAVTSICTQLDGLPLAIELIAARIRLMSPQALLERLSGQFTLYADGIRTVSARQKTLHGAIAWSYDLLSREEQNLFVRLSVFAGGFTLDAAESIFSRTVTDKSVGDLIALLLDKSLLQRTYNKSGEPRFNMLVTIQQFARDHLRRMGEETEVRIWHLAYFVKLAEQVEPELYHSNQAFWLNKLDDELDNLRMALKWALTTAIESGLRIIVFTWLFWRARSYNLEIGEWLAQLLERYNTPDSLRARSSIIYCRCVNDLTRSRIIAEECLELARTLSDKQAEAYSLLNLGEFISLEGNLREGISFVEQSLTLFQALDDKFGQANATSSLSMNNNDLELSKSYVLESLRLHRELGHLWGIADCLVLLAHRTIWGGDFSSPAQWLEEAHMIYRQLGDQSGEAWVLAYYGILAFWMGDYQQACTYYEEAVTLHEKLGNYMDAFWSRVNMAYALLRQRNIPQAKEMFELCIQRFQKANNMIGLVYAIEGLASLNVNQGQPECAARLFAWSNTVREKIDDHRPPIEQASVERDLAVLHSKLNETEFANLSAEGRAMTMEQAIEYALENSDE